MRSKTNNVRRATQDLDIDFIRYQLTDTAIDSFIEKLNCLDGMKIDRVGIIEEFAEKLRSLLRFGPLSTRVKDVFDLYYLKDYIDMGKLQVALNEYIFYDERMRENQGSNIVRRLTRTFKDKEYVDYLEKSDKRWIDEDISVVLNGLLEFADRL